MTELSEIDRIPEYYILKGTKPVAAGYDEWSQWLRRGSLANKLVKRHEFKRYKVTVSTVFLASDHGWGGEPILFETLVFGGKYADDGERYTTWRKARAGHDRWLIKVLTDGLLEVDDD